MADTFGPFDEYPWAEDEWYNFATTWAPDGILVAGDLNLTISGLTLTPGVGRAWVGGAGFKRVTPLESLAVPANTHSSFSRRDRLVLRRSRTEPSVRPFVITGTPLSSPVLPDLARDPDGNWDLPLWNFLTPPNSGTAITSLVDERFVSSTRPTGVGSVLPAHAPDGAIFFLVS